MTVGELITILKQYDEDVRVEVGLDALARGTYVNAYYTKVQDDGREVMNRRTYDRKPDVILIVGVDECES